MKIKNENIILRDMIESDIDDYVRWFTTETEWSNTDAPWESIESDRKPSANLGVNTMSL